MLVDSHCHLDRINLDAYGGNLEGAVLAAKARGVDYMLCVCISESNKDEVVSIAHRYPNIYASVGVHPSDVKDRVLAPETLKSWASDKKIVALGETGLDYYYSREYAACQQASFAHHLEVAADLDLPVIVHTRDAREDTLELIRRHGNEDSGGVLHCFTESWEMAKKALDLNYYISFSGIVTFKNAGDLREVAGKIPLDRLLVETDSPYLAPVPYRGKSNEPKYVREIAEFIAQLRGISFAEFAAITSRNFFRLFANAVPVAEVDRRAGIKV